MLRVRLVFMQEEGWAGAAGAGAAPPPSSTGRSPGGVRALSCPHPTASEVRPSGTILAGTREGDSGSLLVSPLTPKSFTPVCGDET